jgi:hypothetical protein
LSQVICSAACCCPLPKMTTDDAYMLATWASHIKDAAREGRTQYVLAELGKYHRAWRRRTTSPLSPAYSILLTCCATGDRGAETIRSEHVDLARALLDRGADPNLRGRVWTPLHYAARGLGGGSVDMVGLLLDAGGKVRETNSSLVCAIHGFSASDSQRHLNCRRIVRMLLRAGAPLLVLIVDQLERVHPGAICEHFLATRQLILDVHVAGSPQAYRMTSRKQVLLLRSLALKGRAKPRDARMTFLVDSPNEIAWKVLEYWRTELDC